MRFGKCLYAGKTSDDALASYRRSGVICKVGAQSGLHSVLPEAPRGEVTRGLGPRAAPLDELPGTSDLALERPERRLDQLRDNPLPFEIMADGGVAIPAAGRRDPVTRHQTETTAARRRLVELERRSS